MKDLESVPGLITRRDNAVLELRFDRPRKKNSITLEMWQALPRVVSQAAQDPEVRAIVLRGTGQDFSSGADISEFSTVRSTPEQIRAYAAAVESAEQAIAASLTPVIAQVSGFCLGGGLELALACDLRVAGESVRASIPAAKFGIVYSVYSIRRLAAVVGPSYAKWMLYTASTVTAAEGLSRGLFDQMYPDEVLSERTLELAETIAVRSQHTIAAAKTVIESIITETDLSPTALDNFTDAASASNDYQEAMGRFAG